MLRYTPYVSCLLLCGTLLVALVTCAAVVADQGDAPVGADWELYALGITGPERLAAVRALAGQREVSLAIVGQGGVSAQILAPVLTEGNTLEYRQWPQGQPADPQEDTHDTQAARVILDLALKLGLRLRLLIYQPTEAYSDVARAFARAGAEADIVATYQSFWGDFADPTPESEEGQMLQAVRQASGALFISPYAEVGDRPTSTSLQGHCLKPWNGGIPHFITAAPMPFRTPGAILTPLSRPGLDTEIINFIAPSYYANGPGGTCPAAEVTAVVAAWIIAASPQKPEPAAVVDLMRRTVCTDPQILAAIPGYSPQAAASVVQHIAFLASADPNKERKLDAAGVLSLWGVYTAVAEAMGLVGEDKTQ